MLAVLVPGWSLIEVVVAIIIIAAVIAVMYIALRQFGVGIPPWVIQIFWVVVVAFVAIFAIRLLMSM